MSKIGTKPLSGMRDFLPGVVARRRHVVGVVEQVYESYGFTPIETPAIESLATLLGKYGEEGDRLIFRVLRRGEALARVLDAGPPSEATLAQEGLRYDLTVPLARFVAQHKNLPRFFKRYQIQPVWRADRPGRGRFREFYQCDVDITGTSSLVAEAEVCGAVCEVLSRLGFADQRLLLNHRALLRALIASAGIDLSLEGTTLVAVDKLDKIGVEGVEAELEQRGIGKAQGRRLLELLAPEADNRSTAERLRRELSDQGGAAALDDLVQLLDMLERTPAAGHVDLRPDLARGLGYYTGAIFEMTVERLGGSLGGGGRYDELVGMFSRQPVPAVGFSLGLERILLVMDELEMYPELPGGPQLLLCSIGIDPGQLLPLAHALRGQGLRVEVYPEAAKLGKQLQYADGIGATWAAIVGESELGAGLVALKRLASGEQETVAVSEVGRRVADG